MENLKKNQDEKIFFQDELKGLSKLEKNKEANINLENKILKLDKINLCS